MNMKEKEINDLSHSILEFKMTNAGNDCASLCKIIDAETKKIQ
jgi:hypothetical protein